MIPVSAILRAAKVIYPYAVFGFELIKAELKRPADPEPMPLTYRDVEHIRAQVAQATRHGQQP